MLRHVEQGTPINGTLSPRPEASNPRREEWESAVHELQAVTDLTVELGPEEMPAYWRLLRWAGEHSIEELARDAQFVSVYEDFIRTRDKLRGRLLHVDLNVRRILAYQAPANPLGIERLYEVWGWSDEMPDWLCVGVTADLPEGMPLGADIRERARFYGYFLKMQGYFPAGGHPRSSPLAAPLLIGRMIRSTAPPAIIARQDEWWRLGLGSLLAVSLAASLVRLSSHLKVRNVPIARFREVDSSLLEDWLREEEAASQQTPQGHY
jgi:hypothetical protein